MTFCPLLPLILLSQKVLNLASIFVLVVSTSRKSFWTVLAKFVLRMCRNCYFELRVKLLTSSLDSATPFQRDFKNFKISHEIGIYIGQSSALPMQVLVTELSFRFQIKPRQKQSRSKIEVFDFLKLGEEWGNVGATVSA